MSIESLKEQARRHEQKEEWIKALSLYEKAIAELARDDQPDIGLYNRVGDLYVRVGNLEKAVHSYEQAVDLYREAYLPNNAIAVCKKIIRSVPERHEAYLRMGQIRAEQGFIPDARTNFLAYAERMQKVGNLDESFRALIEFCDLAPDDVQIRITVADQMAANNRTGEAVDQLKIAYAHLLRTGESDLTAGLERKILELDPEADLQSVVALNTDLHGEGEIVAQFGEIQVGGRESSSASFSFGDEEEEEDEEREPTEPLPRFDIGVDEDGSPAFSLPEEEAEDEVVEDGADADEDDAEALPMMEAEIDDEDEAPLPTFAFGEEEEEEAAEPLPTFAMDDEDGAAADEDEAEEELPTFAFDDGEEDEAAAEPLPVFSMGDEDGDASDEDDPEGDAEPLPTFAFDDENEEDEAEAAPLPMLSADEGDDDGSGDEAVLDAAAFGEADHGLRESDEYVSEAADLPMIDVGLSDLEDVSEQEPASEAAESLEEAVEEVASRLFEEEAPIEASADEPSVEEPSEPAAPSQYVDLGSMIFGDPGDAQRTTRFQVAYEEPSGDEQADFAKMLSQFKEKVSENLDASDVKAHHDLGTAYKEMGLLDEAVSEFQAALRAAPMHLPTYELLGQTFIEMGKPEAAVKSLERAIRTETGVEDDLIGIYYYLAQAHEQLGQKESAVEFYDRVFSLDINFGDVTERLRDLR